ncbi:MAG: hypothetical protein K2K82_10100 [Muribaculaceae bacterium]|nr:hypothetical protein [Muribaculaceae bacterium]
MKKFFSALAFVAMILFPFALKAKTVTFTINIPEAAYIQEIKNYSIASFDGKTSIEVNYESGITGVQVRANAGYDLVSVAYGDRTSSPYNGSVYVDLDDVADGGTVDIIAKEKEARVFTFTGNPDEVELSHGGLIYDKENNVDGKWTISDTSDYGSYLDIECHGDYIVHSVINNATGQEALYSYNIDKPRVSMYLSASEYPEGANFTISCTTLAEVRTVHVSIEVVDGTADEIVVRRNGTYDPVPSSEWSDLALNPSSELPLQISAADYSKSIYKVEVNGIEQEASYGSFNLNDLKNGDKIKVWPNFPDVSVPVKFTYVNEGTEGAVSSVYVNNQLLDESEWSTGEFTVKLGDKLGVSFNTSGYNISSVTVNGESVSTYSYSETISDETPLTFVIDAEKYPDYTVKLYYPAGTIRVYNSYGTDNPIELPEGEDEVTLTIERGKNYINIVAAEGYAITSAINLETENSVYIPVGINSDMEIAIYTEKFDRDNLCVLYLAPNPASEDGSWNYANVTLSMYDSNLRKVITPSLGYNFIHYAEQDRPFSLSFYPDYKIYINGEESENVYGRWSGLEDLESNSVIKVFAKDAEVPTYNLTIDNQSDGGVEILADYVKALEGTEATVLGATDIEFVTVSATDSEGQSAYIIKVNGEEVTANAEGKTIAHIEADSSISIEVDSKVSITEITSEGNAPIYNLQGMRVKNARGGIFIQNGRKVIL